MAAKWDDPSATWNSLVATWNDQDSLPFNPIIEINPSGTWTDISSYVYYRDSVKITAGQQDETSQVQAGSLQFTLNNRDGRFSPRNPLSPYYGAIGRNTPVRVSMDSPTSYAWMTGTGSATISTPDSAALSVTGDLDIRIEVDLEDWYESTTGIDGNPFATELCGKWVNTGNQGSWILALIGDAKPTLYWSNDGSAQLAVESANSVPVPGNGRMAVRATLDVNNGSGGYTVTFYYSDSISGSWTQLDQTVTTGGTTSIFDSTAPLQLGNVTAITFPSAFGKLFAFEMRNGIGGTVVANPDFTVQADGATSFADGHSNTWTVSGDYEILQREFRFVGEVSSWPSTWDTGGFDVYVPVMANGILRRLGQGARPLQSTLRRHLPVYSPMAYWPMEDGSTSTQAANVVSGGSTMTVSGLQFAQATGLDSSAPLPTFSSSLGTVNVRGVIPPPSGAITSWKVQMVYNLPTAPATQRTVMRVRATGTIVDWQILVGTGGWTVRGYDADSTLQVNSTTTTISSDFGAWGSLRLDLTISGSTVTWVFSRITDQNVGFAQSGTYTGSLGHPTTFLGPDSGFSSDLDGMAIGHVAAFPSKTPEQYGNSLKAYAGETAGARMARLSQEESIQVSIFGLDATEEQVGPQGQQTFLSLVQDAASADGGILYERSTTTALGYRDRNTLVNQDVALSLSYSNSAVIAPLQPSGDDFLIRNDVTVTRTNGSSAVEMDTTSPLSVNAPPDGVGDYSTEYTLNLYDDTRLDFIAGWQLHLGTWDEERYPTVNLAIHNDTSLVPDILALGVGDRMVITDPPAWLPPGDIDLMVIGLSETFNQFLWNVSYVCVPYSAWLVAILNDLVYGRADTEGSELSAGATSAATTLSVATTSGPLWTTAAPDFPFDVTVAGEQVTVTAITGSSSPQTFTVTRSVNGIVKAQSSGADVRLTHPAYTAL